MNNASRILRFLPLNYVVPFIMERKFIIVPTYRGDIKVKLSSNRLFCLGQNPICACCGIVGKFFLLEEDQEQNSCFVNLYAEDSNGELVMITADHILPKSRGGDNSQENLQTLCIQCNCQKKDLILTLDELKDYIAALDKIKYYNSRNQ